MSVPQVDRSPETETQTVFAQESQTETVVASSNDEKEVEYLVHIKDNNEDQDPPIIHTMLVPESVLLQVAQTHHAIAYCPPLQWIKQSVNMQPQLRNAMIWNNERQWEMRIARDLLSHAKSHLFRHQATAATHDIKAEHILELFTHASTEDVDDDMFNLCDTIQFNVCFEIHSMQNCMAITALLLSNLEIHDVLLDLGRQIKRRKAITSDSESWTSDRIRAEWSMKARRLTKQPVMVDTVFAKRFAEALMTNDNLEYFKQRSTAPGLQITDADIVVLAFDCN